MNWSWKSLVVLNVTALFLMASWITPEIRSWLWDPLDYFVFDVTNSSLTWHPVWRELWALSNHRLFDVFAAAAFAGLFLHICKGKPLADVVRHWLTGGLLAIYAFVMLEVTRYVMLDFDRASPSLTVDGAVRLSDWVTWIQFKDFSHASFPSDHAISAFLFTAFIWRLGTWRYGLCATALAIICTLPRVMSGAHWVTDAMVGSAFFTLIGVSLLLATPVHRVCHQYSYQAIVWFLGKRTTLPGVVRIFRLHGANTLN